MLLGILEALQKNVATLLCCRVFLMLSKKKCCYVAVLPGIFHAFQKKCCYVAVLMGIFHAFQKKNVAVLLVILDTSP